MNNAYNEWHIIPLNAAEDLKNAPAACPWAGASSYVLLCAPVPQPCCARHLPACTRGFPTVKWEYWHCTYPWLLGEHVIYEPCRSFMKLSAFALLFLYLLRLRSRRRPDIAERSVLVL